MVQKRKQKTLARANGTSRRASGWPGEKGDPFEHPARWIPVIPGRCLSWGGLIDTCSEADDNAENLA